MKKWYESKTLWFAVLTVVIGIASAFGFGDFQLGPENADLVRAVIIVLVGVINAVLRLATTQTIQPK